MKDLKNNLHAPDQGASGSTDIETDALACKLKQPLVRITKREHASLGYKVFVILACLLLALLTGALLFLAIGKNPLEAYKTILTGSFGTATTFRQTIMIWIPLLVTGLAVGMAFRMKFWNIGGEGQILMGGIAATSMVIYTGLSGTPLLILMAVAALIGGGIFAAVPGFFKAKWGTNETLFTLMLNYIAINLLTFLQHQKAWQASGSSFPIVKDISDRAALPTVFNIHIGWIFALVLAVLVYFYLNKTKQGYEIAVVGDSINTARYAGMNTNKIQVRTVALSGALCGFVGYMQVAGADGTLTQSTSGGVGFTAITVAWLAKLNPFAMIVVAMFIAVLQRGSLAIQSQMRIPASAADLLTGLILFFMLATDFFIEYKLIFRGRSRTLEEEV
ncbi:MAG: ABC transporter permease [Eubacteriales bacterium]|nr:ABC transporter permease [Eubacteriales bacterium]MDD4323628.1 ABC transporter permease [Eubacteriales bacterium]MDD4540626.1 ABC transporter permease [Eubacteriales bacterium]